MHVTIFLALIYAIGILGLSLHLTRELFLLTTPFTLLLSLLLLGIFHEKYTRRFILVAVTNYLAGFFIEMAGVTTGLVFGSYSYGATLGVKVWGTPLMIGVNWLVLVYCVWIMMSRWQWHLLLKAFLGSLLMVFYDFFLEPVAIWTDMWSWDAVAVPVQNYVAWFVTSFVLLILIGALTPGIKNKIAPALFIIQLAFFILLFINIKIFF